MAFREQLVQAIQQGGMEKVLADIGYKHPNEKQIGRLSQLMISPLLGLDKGGFDFKYSSGEYVVRLAEVCGLDTDEAKAWVDQAEQQLVDDKMAFKPYIFIETGFKRASQPIFALAVCEHFRYITFPGDFYKKLSGEKLAMATEAVLQHQKETGGDTGIWGKALAYILVDSEEHATGISPTGEIIGEYDGYQPASMARMFI